MTFPVVEALQVIADQRQNEAVVTMVSHRRDPFQVLISCLISLRTKDAVTAAASDRLFAEASDPVAILELDQDRIAELIYPAGFYKTKAAKIKAISTIIIEEHGGSTPDTLDDLMALPGVGLKTANLVLGLGFQIPAICVDSHVHRISNRWGLVQTKNPEQTEEALRKVLPRSWWIPINDLLVSWGQTICQPLSPHCSSCPLLEICPQTGLKYSR